MNRIIPRGAVLGACLLLTACPADDGHADDHDHETGDAGEDELEIVGEYVDDYMFEHTITATEWQTGGAIFLIEDYDNDEMWVVAQNHPDNEYNPEQWSRFDWAWDGEQLYYCQSVFDGATVEDALDGGAKRDDLMMGCGGFAWSMLDPL